MSHSCSCGKTWTGSNMAHCPSCHETFSNISNFDAHRVGHVDKRRCLSTSEFVSKANLRQNDRGTWLREDESDVTEWLKRTK